MNSRRPGTCNRRFSVCAAESIGVVGGGGLTGRTVMDRGVRVFLVERRYARPRRSPSVRLEDQPLQILEQMRAFDHLP